MALGSLLCWLGITMNRRAKDGELEMSRRLVAVVRMVSGRVARTLPLAVAPVVVGYSVCFGPTDGQQLAAGGRRQPRLPGLLLLHPDAGPQGYSVGRAVVGRRAAANVPRRTNCGGVGRLAHQTLRPACARRRDPSQSDS